MFVPTPRKMKEIRKMAESKMATSLTQKPILSRFIIMRAALQALQTL
jgi:hypothetical protein